MGVLPTKPIREHTGRSRGFIAGGIQWYVEKVRCCPEIDAPKADLNS